MSVTTIPIEIFELLEDKLGREDAKKVAESINLSLGAIESKANDLAMLKKVEIKEELTKELATKADIAILEKELENKATKADLKELEGRINTLELRLTVKLGTIVAAGIAVVAVLVKLL